MTAAFPPPPQTGHADFPHPAFAWHLIWSIHHASEIWLPIAASLFSEGICSVVGFLQSVPSPSESALPRQGRFAPRALPRFLATTSLSDSHTPNARLMDSPGVSSRLWRNWSHGPPSLPNPTFPARCPLSPRRAPALLSNVSSHRMAGFNPSGSLAALIWFNEADSGSLALRLTGSLHRASARRLLTALSVSLHAGRSVRMMNTFQFISSVGGAGAPEGNEENKVGFLTAFSSRVERDARNERQSQ
jgi:hypothetical protein